MMECDKLYGVTMQERGVSKHVAVTIDEVSKDGNLTIAARNRAEEPEMPIPVTVSQIETPSVTA